MEPATVHYLDRSYDFEPALLGGLDVRRSGSRTSLVLRLVRRPLTTLEINEPLMVPGLRTAVPAVAAVRIADRVRRRRTAVVTYAIENADPYRPGSGSSGLRGRLRRWSSRWLAGQLDRVAFGTAAAAATYEPHLGHFRGRTAIVPALPEPCRRCEPATDQRQRHVDSVVFVGAFNERKGIRELLAAWPAVVAQVPSAHLVVLGKGTLEPLVREAAASDSSITVLVDPARVEVHEALRTSHVAVLLSVAWRGWREQVGLPLVEALAHGCEVVTTDQTGLAGWLVDHGHRVIATDPVTGAADPAEAAVAIAAAIAADRSATQVRDDLPDRDGRLAADDWLFAADRTDGVSP